MEPSDIYDALAHELLIAVLERVAEHPDTTVDTLSRLAVHESPEVSKRAQETLASTNRASLNEGAMSWKSF